MSYSFIKLLNILCRTCHYKYHCQAIAEFGLRKLVLFFFHLKGLRQYDLFFASVELQINFQVSKYLLLFFPLQVLSAG